VTETALLRWIIALPALGVLFNVFVGRRATGAVKIVGPDSASFTMWLAGDAEREAIAWFDRVDYDRAPGMAASVLKADHHGSCDGLTRRYLDLVRPRFAVIS
jgi:hypothetical protein